MHCFVQLVFGEFSCSWKSLQVFLYLIMAIGVGVVTAYFFLENMWEWSDPTSHYRSNDEDCLFLQPYPFYDKHDAFHIVSAHALFLIFMVHT